MRAPIRTIALALAVFAMGCMHAVVASPLDEAMKGYKYLRVERHGAILIVRFYNPPTNLMSGGMIGEIGDLVHHVDADTQSRVLIFTGGVLDYFIQHYDTREFTKPPATKSVTPPPPQYAINITDRILLELSAVSKPTIAAINGHAQGGGLKLALACDFRIIGAAHAKEMIMLGRVIDAGTAVRYGVVMKAVPPDQLMSESMQLAERLAALSPASLALIKKVINASFTMPFEDALKLEDYSFDVLVRTDEAQRLTQRYLQRNQRWGASQEGLPP
jgi:enoyl-CoA hydratase/carnithine racemase